MNVPYFKSGMNTLMMIKIENSVFGLWIDKNCKFERGCYNLKNNDYKLFSLQNQFETKPFVFTSIEKPLEFKVPPKSSEFIIEIPQILKITRNTKKIQLSEISFNQRFKCNLHSPSEFLSNSKEKPLSSSTKNIEEMIFYEVESK